jgi:hypothetical protein
VRSEPSLKDKDEVRNVSGIRRPVVEGGTDAAIEQSLKQGLHSYKPVF